MRWPWVINQSSKATEVYEWDFAVMNKSVNEICVKRIDLWCASLDYNNAIYVFCSSFSIQWTLITVVLSVICCLEELVELGMEMRIRCGFNPEGRQHWINCHIRLTDIFGLLINVPLQCVIKNYVHRKTSTNCLILKEVKTIYSIFKVKVPCYPLVHGQIVV